jgi:L-threonylcarbamoyladenylate synthase
MKLSLLAAVEALRASKVVAVPTETFYGLAACADDPVAVATLFRLKGRRPALPSPLLVPSRAAVSELLKSGLDARTAALADRFWPGALTLVVAGARGELPPGVTGADGTVGVRQDGHPELAALLRAFGRAVTGTSANVSGAPPCRDGGEVDGLFQGQAGYAGYIGEGRTQGDAPSTIVRVVGRNLEVLREGALEPREVLEVWEVLGVDLDNR